jgi:hypothetical protein
VSPLAALEPTAVNKTKNIAAAVNPAKLIPNTDGFALPAIA